MSSSSPAPLVLTGEATPVRQLVRDLVRTRDLLPMLARQHFRGQFRAARLGLAWSALQPLIRGAVLAVVFTLFVPIETDEPYPAFVLAGSASWAFLSGGVQSGTTGIVSSAGLAGRVYFPRVLLAAMPAAAALPSYLITLAIVIPLGVVFGATFSWTVLLLPLAIALGFALVATMSMCLSLLYVYFRDVGQLVSTGIGVLFYATPIIYPLEQTGTLGRIVEINPFTGAVGVVRWTLFGGSEQLGLSLVWTVVWTVALGVVGTIAFSRHDRICMDRL